VALRLDPGLSSQLAVLELYQSPQRELKDRQVGGGMNMIEIPSKHIEVILSGAAGDPCCFDKDHHYKQDN
jgi:hypothetical protein